MQNLFTLKNQTAVITGGGGLFGKQLTEALCEAGANTIITWTNNIPIDFVAELKEKGYVVEAVHLNQADENSIIDFKNYVLDKYKNIDILVNNAVKRNGGDIEDSTKEQWEDTAKVNSTGLFLMCKHFLEPMRKQSKGVIINIGSIQGCGAPNFNVYEGTDMSSPAYYTFEKWGMVGLTKYIAAYYGKYGVRCNCLSPGGYYNGQNETFVESYCKFTPLGRMADNQDLKGPIVFLASDASRYMTGQNLIIDGGWTIW